MLLSDCVFPGSHDSGAYKLAKNQPDYAFSDDWPRLVSYLPGNELVVRRWTLTQSLSIAEQLNAGVRSLDLRISVDREGTYWISHTFACVKLRKVIRQLRDFMLRDRSATVLVRCTDDHAHRDAMTKRHMTRAMGLFVKMMPEQLMQRRSTLGFPQEDAAGKVLLFCNAEVADSPYLWESRVAGPRTFPADLKEKKQVLKEFIAYLEQMEPKYRKRTLAVLPLTLTPDAEVILNPLDAVWSTEALAKLIEEPRYRWKLNYGAGNVVSSDFVDNRFIGFVKQLQEQKLKEQ